MLMEINFCKVCHEIKSVDLYGTHTMYICLKFLKQFTEYLVHYSFTKKIKVQLY